MLILTRRVGEIVKIGDDIEIQVINVNGQQVRIGIAAPKNVSVDRQEVRDRKDRERLPIDRFTDRHRPDGKFNP